VSIDRSFLEEVFGNAEGYAHFAVGHGAYVDPTDKYKFGDWEQFSFLWPQQADDAMRQLDDVLSQPGSNDLYVCPNILKTDRRNKDTAVTHRLLHSDADNGADANRLKPLAAFAVASGTPGHSHVFVQLARDVTLAEYQTLQQGMRTYVNGDHKISDNDLLRPVGSVNHKAVVLHSLDEPYPVNWIVKPSGLRMDPEAVAAVLGVTLPSPDEAVPESNVKRASSAAPRNAGSGPHGVEAVDLARHPRVEAAIGENTGDRSKDTLRIVGACYDDHLTLEQARWLVNTRADLAERLDDRKDDDVQSCWIKVVNSRQGQPASISDSEKTEKTEKRSVATKLVEIARTLYDLGLSDDGTPYGTQPAVPHVALPLRGSKTGLRANLARDYFERNNAVASQQALADALAALEGFAAQAEPCRLHLRVAQYNGTVYIDLADPGDHVIAINGGEWEVSDTAPVVFRRTELTAPMPIPIRSGDLAKLWDLINVAKSDRPILLAFMVAALIQPLAPHVILGLLAEHGSAKSTTTRRVVSLTDPSVVPLRMPPRDIDAWVTAANGSWVVALDNLSHIADWFSDALCRAATGDGNVKRQLYTDNDLAVIQFLRCIIINGIDIGGLNGDLTDRLALVDLGRITEAQRRDETELEAEWRQAYPAILGGLLDLAAKVHHMLPNIRMDRLPRMADYAKVLACIDEIHHTEGLQRYRERATHLAADSVAADPFIARLQEISYTAEDVTAAEILAHATPTDPGWRRPQDWPKKPRMVSTRLTRHAPTLRALGWHIESDRGQNKAKTTRWTITAPEAAGGSTEGQACHGKSPDPPRNTAPTCADGLAGLAGHIPGSSLGRDHTGGALSLYTTIDMPTEEGRDSAPPDPSDLPPQVNVHKSGGSDNILFPGANPPIPVNVRPVLDR
jgi:hypothetical protein